MSDERGGTGRRATLSEERVSELRTRLLATVRRSCPSWIAAHAEDIVQNAIIRVIRACERSGGDLDLNPSYLKKAAYSAAVDEMRRQFRHREFSRNGRAEAEVSPPGSAHPESGTAALDVYEGIRDCLGRMIRSRRTAVACHLQGYSVPETARFLGWTPKKAEHLVRRGLDDLRACLAGKGLTP